jgi:GAF domain-containing protein
MISKKNLSFDYFRELTKRIYSTLDLKEILSIFVKEVAEVINLKGCAIRLIDPDKRTLKLVSSYGLSEKYIGKGFVYADLSIAEVMEGKMVFIPDATNDPRVQYQKEAMEEGICSILSVPLSIKGQVIGVLRLYTSEPRKFSEEEINFIEAVAEIGAIAIENARRYEDLRKDYEYVISDIFNFFEYRRTI